MTKEYTIQHEIELIREKVDELQSALISLETLCLKAQFYPELLEEKVFVELKEGQSQDDLEEKK